MDGAYFQCQPFPFFLLEQFYYQCTSLQAFYFIQTCMRRSLALSRSTRKHPTHSSGFIAKPTLSSTYNLCNNIVQPSSISFSTSSTVHKTKYDCHLPTAQLLQLRLLIQQNLCHRISFEIKKLKLYAKCSAFPMSQLLPPSFDLHHIRLASIY